MDMTWQPIETAPPCATVLVTNGSAVAVARRTVRYSNQVWSKVEPGNAFADAVGFNPTHWHPIPETSHLRCCTEFYDSLTEALTQARGNPAVLGPMKDWPLREVADLLAPNGIRMVYIPGKALR
jgi:hypothetical protein